MRLTRPNAAAAIASLLLGVALCRCTGGTVATGTQNGPHSITVEPTSVDVEAGKSTDVTVHVFDGVNHEISAQQWLPGCSVKAEPAGVANVSVVGGKVRVTGVSHGTATVTITCSSSVTRSFTVEVSSATPTITSVNPNPARKGWGEDLTITGTGFSNETVVKIDGHEHAVLSVNQAGTEMTVFIGPDETDADGKFSVEIQAYNPPDGLPGFISLPLVYGVPIIGTLSPASAVAGSPDLSVRMLGVGITPKSVVRWQGINLATTWPAPTRVDVRAVIPAILLTTPGTYSITVFNPTPGGGTSNALEFEVTPGANATFDFSDYEPQVVMAAVKQGNGSYVQVPISNKLAQFAVTAANASFAFVSSILVPVRGAALNAGGGRPAVSTVYQITVLQLTQQEMAGTHRMAFRHGTTPLSGTVSGLGAGDVAGLLWGNAEATTTGSFSMTTSTAGTHALAGYRKGAGGPSAADRVFLRQNQASAAGVSVDFTGPESAPVATATATLSGLIAGDNAIGQMGYLTEPTCEGTLFYSTAATASQLITGFPTSLQGPNDIHLYRFFIFNGTTTLQQTFYSKQLIGFAGSRPPVPNTPAVTNVSGAPYQIKQAAVDLGTYNAGTLYYSNMAVTASRGFLGGQTGTITAPDLTGVPGWNSSYAPTATSAWTFGTSTTTAVGPTCVNGSVVSTASVSGTN